MTSSKTAGVTLGLVKSPTQTEWRVGKHGCVVDVQALWLQESDRALALRAVGSARARTSEKHAWSRSLARVHAGLVHLLEAPLRVVPLRSLSPVETPARQGGIFSSCSIPLSTFICDLTGSARPPIPRARRARAKPAGHFQQVGDVLVSQCRPKKGLSQSASGGGSRFGPL